MRARAYCAHPAVRNYWELRCMSKYSDKVVSLKQKPQCFSPQASLVHIYGPTVGMKGRVDFHHPGSVVWKIDTLPVDLFIYSLKIKALNEIYHILYVVVIVRKSPV
ncbi:hypothetical protein TNCV_1496551 [Trichonephila clavipes]|nr:hypothetical protein TNCV_1496551 [Trichonephila clavipes]